MLRRLACLPLFFAPALAQAADPPHPVSPTETLAAIGPREPAATSLAPARAEPTEASASPAPTATLDEPAHTYHRRRTALGLAGMGTLTGWAVANIAGGVAGNLTTTGTVRFFHQGNAAWNTVNLVLGISGLVSQGRERARPVDRATGLRRARRSQVVFGINAGLDILYISTGAILWPLGADRDHDRIHGYGQALVLQGAFLFAFDVAMMLAHELAIERRPGRSMARVRLAPVPMSSPSGGLAAGLALRLRRPRASTEPAP